MTAPRATVGSWAIVDHRGVIYLDVGHRTRKAAEEALADLLVPYEPGSRWHRELRVERVRPAETAFGSTV